MNTENLLQMPEVSFQNTKDAFAYKKDAELKQAHFLFSMMGNSLMLRMGLLLIPPFMKIRFPFIKSLVRNTIFNQFVGGETLKETEPWQQKFAEYGVSTVIDYGVEGKSEDDAGFDAVAGAFTDVIRYAASGKYVGGMSIKATGFMRMALMEKVDALMRSGDGLITDRYQQAVSMLDDSEKREWERAAQRFMDICKAGYENRVIVWVDAEETWLQEPVDALTLMMMEKYNGREAVIYNTIQLYRHDRLEFLKESHRFTSHRHVVLGVKLVRGAYMEKERNRAVEKNYDSPIQPDKESADRDYDEAVAYCMKNIEDISLTVATHNEQSTRKAVQLMTEAGLEPGDKRIHFAQLMGMSDHITFNLAHHGFNAQKLVPFGPINDVIPYLMRRAQENSSVKGQTGRELRLIKQEITRRKSQS